MVLRDIDYVRRKLEWMRENAIWPNGLRSLWTDAFGLVLYTSLYEETGEPDRLDAAEHLLDEVYRVLGRKRGLRIGEEADRDGQYYHYLIIWVFALHIYGRYHPASRGEAVRLVWQIHPRFVLPGRGMIWKMQEDLSGPCPGPIRATASAASMPSTATARAMNTTSMPLLTSWPAPPTSPACSCARP